MIKPSHLLLALALPAFAAQPAKPPKTPAPSNSATLGSTAGVIVPLTVKSTAELSFGSVGASTAPAGGLVIIASKPGGQFRSAVRVTLNANGGETPLIRTLTGQPGQSYRINLPTSVQTSLNNLTVQGFTAYSSNSKDVSTTRLAALDNKGTDSLRIGATLVMPYGTPGGTYVARVPVMLAYE